MPTYFYRCDNCEFKFKEKHSMEKTRLDCWKCNTRGSLSRVPPPFRFKVEIPADQPAGVEVRHAIDETKEILKQELEEASKKEWIPE